MIKLNKKSLLGIELHTVTFIVIIGQDTSKKKFVHLTLLFKHEAILLITTNRTE